MPHLVRVLNAAICAALVLAGLVLAVPAANAVDYDCADFSTQAQAQKFLTPGDPMRLDADGDGRACDSLPCPCSAAAPPAQQPATVRERARVIRVVDGDTLRVRLSNGQRRYVRLLGIDTPEVYGSVQCYGPQASAAARRLLPRGTRVVLTSDRSQARVDRYGRLLRYVARGRLDVDRQLVLLGAARVYVYGGTPFARVSSYRSAQAAAQAAHRGLWRSCA